MVKKKKKTKFGNIVEDFGIKLYNEDDPEFIKHQAEQMET
jgi:hypothetical protein